MLILFAIIAGGFLITIKLIGYICAKNGNEHNKKDDAAKVMKYLKQNAAIQTEVFGKGTAAKRQIFDGFYCVMRNFLIGVGITNVYSIIMAFWIEILIYYVGLIHFIRIGFKSLSIILLWLECYIDAGTMPG